MEVATVERGLRVVFFCRIAIGGRDAVDLVDVGLFHALQKLARVGGERFDVAPLALGVDGVEGERRLARARDAGDHGQLVVRDRERDVLEVVDPGAAHGDGVVSQVELGHALARFGSCGLAVRRVRGTVDLEVVFFTEDSPWVRRRGRGNLLV